MKHPLNARNVTSNSPRTQALRLTNVPRQALSLVVYARKSFLTKHLSTIITIEFISMLFIHLSVTCARRDFTTKLNFYVTSTLFTLVCDLFHVRNVTKDSLRDITLKYMTKLFTSNFILFHVRIVTKDSPRKVLFKCMTERFTSNVVFFHVRNVTKDSLRNIILKYMTKRFTQTLPFPCQKCDH